MNLLLCQCPMIILWVPNISLHHLSSLLGWLDPGLHAAVIVKPVTIDIVMYS